MLTPCYYLQLESVKLTEDPHIKSNVKTIGFSTTLTSKLNGHAILYLPLSLIVNHPGLRQQDIGIRPIIDLPSKELMIKPIIVTGTREWESRRN